MQAEACLTPSPSLFLRHITLRALSVKALGAGERESARRRGDGAAGASLRGRVGSQRVSRGGDPDDEPRGDRGTRRHRAAVPGLRHHVLRASATGRALTRGLHSPTSQLNLSAFYGIGGVRKGLCSPYDGSSQGVIRVSCRVLCLCQTRLKLS